MKKKNVIVAAVFASLVLGGVAAYVYSQKDTGKTKYPGATAEERAETEARKPQLIKDNEAKTTPNDRSASTTPQTVTPVITSAGPEDGKVVVAAYIPGIFEEGGTCKLEATKDGLTVAATSEAFANVSTTNCAPFRLERSQFASSGTWSVRVSYQSESATGVSANQTLVL